MDSLFVYTARPITNIIRFLKLRSVRNIQYCPPIKWTEVHNYVNLSLVEQSQIDSNENKFNLPIYCEFHYVLYEVTVMDEYLKSI